jgi:hypothetical protein
MLAVGEWEERARVLSLAADFGLQVAPPGGPSDAEAAILAAAPQVAGLSPLRDSSPFALVPILLSQRRHDDTLQAGTVSATRDEVEPTEHDSAFDAMVIGLDNRLSQAQVMVPETDATPALAYGEVDAVQVGQDRALLLPAQPTGAQTSIDADKESVVVIGTWLAHPREFSGTSAAASPLTPDLKAAADPEASEPSRTVPGATQDAFESGDGPPTEVGVGDAEESLPARPSWLNTMEDDSALVDFYVVVGRATAQAPTFTDR